MSQTEGWVLIKKLEPIGALSLLFRYGENSGDSKRTVTGVAPQFLDRCRDGLASLHYRVSTFDFFGARLALSF